MDNSKTLNAAEISDVIENTIRSDQNCIMSYLSKGKWHRSEIKIHAANRLTLILDLTTFSAAADSIQIDQPLSVAFEMDFTKYFFESTVIGFEPESNDQRPARLMIKKPISAEQMMRRAYTRVSVPDEMNVEALFWHRGYSDNSLDTPLESYWQGTMLDLSAGGTLISVSKDLFDNFKMDQFIGMQFTPLPYEKPVIVEAQIKHIADSPKDEDMLWLGIEFLGLEASADGKEKLEKIIETIQTYQKVTA